MKIPYKAKVENLRKKRWHKELKRRRDKKSRKRQITTSWGTDSPLLRFARVYLRGADRSQYVLDATNRSRWIIKLPKKFCFLVNPNETLDTLYSMVCVSRKIKKDDILYIDQRECEIMDIGACAVLDVLALEIRQETRCSVGGKYPDNENVRNIVQCMGITRHLKIKDATPSEEVLKKFKILELIRGKKKSRRICGRSDQERAATNLTNHLDECIRHVSNYSLSPQAKRAILQWSGEIITNAEEHSGKNDWYAISYMTPCAQSTENPSQDNAEIGECHLAIFSFGRTIAESLIHPNVPSQILDELHHLADVHSRKQFFSTAQFSKNDLITLYALQDGISRFSTIPGGNTRGTGTVQIIESFQNFGDSIDETKNPEMALISGDTRIYFTKKYKMKMVDVINGQRKVIAFNSNNSLEEKPDSDNVHTLSGFFPGTILTFSFYLDKKYLSQFHDPTTGTIDRISGYDN